MNDSKEYWFKRKRYGWGWTPVTWEGWLVMIVAIAAPVAVALTFPPKPEDPTPLQKMLFGASLIFAVGSLLVANYFKGPSPRWRWGKSVYDDPDEDF